MATCKESESSSFDSMNEEGIEYIHRDDDDFRPPPKSKFTAYSNQYKNDETGKSINQTIVATGSVNALQFAVNGDATIHLGNTSNFSNCKFNKKPRAKKDKNQTTNFGAKQDIHVPDEILKSTAEVTEEMMETVMKENYKRFGWETLASFLDVPDIYMDEVKNEHPKSGEDELVFHLLKKWAQITSRCNCIVGTLATALQNLDAADIAIKLGRYSSLVRYNKHDG